VKCTVRTLTPAPAAPVDCRPAVDSTRRLNIGALFSAGVSITTGGTRMAVLARWEEMLNDIWPEAEAKTKSFTVLWQLYLF
jgi:hypothetical protein